MRFLPLCAAALLAACPLQAAPGRQTLRRAFPLHIPQVAGMPRTALPLADPAAQDLLRQMLQAENTLPLSGDQVTLVVRNGLDISSEQQIQRNGARALRLDYLRPARLAGEQIIDNGRFYCHLVPSRDTLELSPSRIQTLRVRVPQVIQQIRAGRLLVQQIGQETVAGHFCGILQVMARSAAPVPFQKFWVDPINGAQLRNEQYDDRGQLQSASYYTQVTYSPVFDRSTFRLPSSGGKVVMNGFAAPTLTLDQVRAQAGFPVQVPSALPDGFHYQGGSVSDRRNTRVVELRYSNSVNGLSVFETPDTADGSSRPQHPRRGVLFGRQNGLKVVIIANLGNGELDSTLASLR